MIEIQKDPNLKDRSKEVLQKLKEQERKPTPKLDKEVLSFKAKMQQQRQTQNLEPRPSPSFYQQRLERVLNKLEDLEKNMKQGKDYFTAYWDYQKIAKEFLLAAQELERFEKAFIPKAFQDKVNQTKIKVNQALKRAKTNQGTDNTPATDMF